MENEAREHLNLAHYNFNRMAVIHEEEIGDHISQPKSKQGGRIQGPPEINEIKNMHNTTTGFYPQRFGDRVPTRGDLQSRCGRSKQIPSAQGGKRGNSRADNSLGRIK